MTRRQTLSLGTSGFAAVALSGLMHNSVSGRDAKLDAEALPAGAALPATHHGARAKHVIFCYMSGGVSHVDSFDPKPKLARLHGKPMPVAVQRTQFNRNGNVFASPFEFTRHGESGIPISSMFPQLGTVADELAVVRSMTTTANEHAQGNFVMHTGFPFMGFPAAGAWCAYGLGSENENLPSYVVLQSGNAIPPHGGVSLFSNGFLPAQHQGSILQADRAEAIRDLQSPDGPAIQSRRLEFAKLFDQQFLDATGNDQQIAAAIKNYETAFRMQTAVPEVCDLSGETQETQSLYGIDSSNPLVSAYARQCLLARRLVQRGVRFIELSCLTAGIGAGGAANPWDQHGDLENGHRAMGEQVDQPIAALVQDLKRCGLLDETLIVWAGEFGRTPFSQGSNGRDHNPFGFSIWMAGGGVRGGTIHGATDELGYHAVENPANPYDLWATVLHLMGIDHTRLTYRYSGRDMRLTDVHGNVMKPILESESAA
ncbi:DUF1501 domain-containing protein [Stieleria varia]|uniref:Sulfatase n=1 Tax=Stieleria varia TaxID=2528005 RepID=A0A5C6A0F6_9BACT|nr:DUF1501 domain-containing protein [Stieleria varia]TWT93304.1 hypothetical protein Pla52n_59640 [Stieleria varia]